MRRRMHPIEVASDTPKVLDKALRVLRLFTERSPSWRTTDIARELDLPLTTTHRIVRGLESHQLVRRTSSGDYRLGLAAISLGRRAVATFDLRQAFRPGLEWLSAQTDETTSIATIDDDRLSALFVDLIDRSHPVRASVEVGTVTPLYAGAHGRAMLAHLDEAELERVLAHGLEALAVGTISSADALRESLVQVREQGFAFACDETHAGVWEMAAPILDVHGIPLASIGFHSPTLRLDPELERRGGTYVLEAARRASTTTR